MSDISKTESNDNNYWRSFNDLYNNEEFIEASKHEFKEGVTEDFKLEDLSRFSRKKFLALLGASAALAAAGCSNYRDNGDIIPYNKKPEEILPGEPNYYASTCTGCAVGCGILIKTREGRPIKIDGNPDHPINNGKICAKGHASILNLYDPERLQSPMRRSIGILNKASWKSINDEILSALGSAGNKKIAVITDKIVSPTEMKLLNDFVAKYPTTKHYSYQLFNDVIRNSAWKKSGGTGNFPIIDFSKAKVILALEADILYSEGNTIENLRAFASNRDSENIEAFNRFYTAEANLSVTGMNSDYRFKISPALMLEFINSLESSINGNEIPLNDFAKKAKLNQKHLKFLVKDLNTNKGAGLIYAGDKLPEAIHIEVNKLNKQLSNDSLYITESTEVSLHNLSTDDELKELMNEMGRGNVAVVINYGIDSAYLLPEYMGFKKLLNKVNTVITLTESENESSELSNYVLPIHHNFECWGDVNVRKNIVSTMQPVIKPLLDTRQKEGIVLSWINGGNYSETTYLEYLTKNWEEKFYSLSDKKSEFKTFWNKALHDGVTLQPDGADSVEPVILKDIPIQDMTGYTLILKESGNVGDGYFANNGWLLEYPHPVSKIVWDNYAAISTATAKNLNLKNNDLIKISYKNNSLDIPVFIQPGCTDNTITIELGWGRSKIGTVGNKAGFNANPLLSSFSAFTPWIIPDVKIEKTGGTYQLTSTQEHHSFDVPREQDLHLKRKIIREATVAEYKKDKKILGEDKEKEHKTFYSDSDELLKKSVKWGMAIDLNKCTGCGECTIACISENNVPVVGKEQVEKGREMQWLRIDRYYSGKAEDPKVSVQPMLCQHCDHAPCENVCPVAATTHSSDGLNQMAYNRCVGTRYCSNNCPFKVRRFNFFNFRDKFDNGIQEQNIFQLLYNPEVTVRSRGVMEKCTFCIQRIMKARQDSIANNVELKGNMVTTACQDACSTNAIKFGDQLDKNGEFYKYLQHDLAYYVLEELNVRPNVTYIAKLRNTFSEEA